MTQASWTPLNAGVDDGSTLSTKLNDIIPALLSMHEGAAPPPNPRKGQIYGDTSLADQFVFKLFNGAGWNNILAVNTKTGVVTLPGQAASQSEFPTGTRLIFQQTSAPTGWVKDTGYNDHALRITNGNVSRGGTFPFTTVFRAHTVTGTVQGHTLTLHEMPYHGHQSNNSNIAYANASSFFVYPINGGGPNYIGYGPVVMDAVGGNGAHDHPFVGNNIDLTVQYADVIIAQKS